MSSELVAELARERAAHRQTVDALELERTAHAETRLVVLAMMQAVDIHVNQLRDAIQECHDAGHADAAVALSDRMADTTDTLRTLRANAEKAQS